MPGYGLSLNRRTFAVIQLVRRSWKSSIIPIFNRPVFENGAPNAIIFCGDEQVEVLSEQPEALIIFDAVELGRDGSFSLRYIQDSGKPLPKPPPPVWVPGSENRLFRGLQIGNGGEIEKFILNAIPKIRDPQRPAESIASILTEFTLGQILG